MFVTIHKLQKLAEDNSGYDSDATEIDSPILKTQLYSQSFGSPERQPSRVSQLYSQSFGSPERQPSKVSQTTIALTQKSPLPKQPDSPVIVSLGLPNISTQSERNPKSNISIDLSPIESDSDKTIPLKTSKSVVSVSSDSTKQQPESNYEVKSVISISSDSQKTDVLEDVDLGSKINMPVAPYINGKTVEFLFVDDYVLTKVIPTKYDIEVRIPDMEKKRKAFKRLLSTKFKNVNQIECEENDFEPVLDNPNVDLRILVLEVKKEYGDSEVERVHAVKNYFTITYPFITIILIPDDLKNDGFDINSIDFLKKKPKTKNIKQGNYYSDRMDYPNGKLCTMVYNDLDLDLAFSRYDYVFSMLNEAIDDNYDGNYRNIIDDDDSVIESSDRSSIYSQDKVKEARLCMGYEEFEEIKLNGLKTRFRRMSALKHPDKTILETDSNVDKQKKTEDYQKLVLAYRVLSSTLK